MCVEYPKTLVDALTDASKHILLERGLGLAFRSLPTELV